MICVTNNHVTIFKCVLRICHFNGFTYKICILDATKMAPGDLVVNNTNSNRSLAMNVYFHARDASQAAGFKLYYETIGESKCFHLSV